MFGLYFILLSFLFGTTEVNARMAAMRMAAKAGAKAAAKKGAKKGAKKFGKKAGKKAGKKMKKKPKKQKKKNKKKKKQEEMPEEMEGEEGMSEGEEEGGGMDGDIEEDIDGGEKSEGSLGGKNAGKALSGFKKILKRRIANILTEGKAGSESKGSEDSKVPFNLKSIRRRLEKAITGGMD